MTAQIANGGYQIKPRGLYEDTQNDLKSLIKLKNEKPDTLLSTDIFFKKFNLDPLFRNKENINFIKDAMYAATNEPGGTSYRSRFTKKEFIFAGKTGSSQKDLQRNRERPKLNKKI